MAYIKLEHSQARHDTIKRLARRTGDKKMSYLINRLIDDEAARVGMGIEPAVKPGGYQVQKYQDEIARLKRELAERDD